MNRAALLGWARIRSASSRVVALTVVASAAVVVFALFQRWPAWAVVAAALVPWVPLFAIEVSWTQRHYGWLSLFFVLVVTQGGHMIEHIVQMYQIHVLGLMGLKARGVFGALDIEWVHFVWNTWVLLAVVLLVFRFRRNPWLWATLVLATWHESEHIYILSVYLRTHVAGSPGLLAKGGVIAGGLPIKRPDLHFFYNVAETIPLFAAFTYQLRGVYDAWLARAFPKLSAETLARYSPRLRTRRFQPGDMIVREGELARGAFVVVRGEVDVVRNGGVERRIATIGPGQLFGEVGLIKTGTRTAGVRAVTPAEVLELDAATFRELLEESPETAAELRKLARRRGREVKPARTG
jgi:hypothetical protein